MLLLDFMNICQKLGKQVAFIFPILALTNNIYCYLLLKSFYNRMPYITCEKAYQPVHRTAPGMARFQSGKQFCIWIWALA